MVRRALHSDSRGHRPEAELPSFWHHGREEERGPPFGHKNQWLTGEDRSRSLPRTTTDDTLESQSHLCRSTAPMSQSSSCKPGNDTNLAGSSDLTKQTSNETHKADISHCFFVRHLDSTEETGGPPHRHASVPSRAYLTGLHRIRHLLLLSTMENQQEMMAASIEDCSRTPMETPHRHDAKPAQGRTAPKLQQT